MTRRWVQTDGSYVETYTFEGRDIEVSHFSDLGAFGLLSDLCEIHWCGAPETVIGHLTGEGLGTMFTFDDGPEPLEALIELGSCEMETIRSLCSNWAVAERFRTWLLDVVLPDSPHFQHEEQRWARLQHRTADAGLPWLGEETAAAWRERRWREELAERPLTRVH